jgi:hypothetical protein
LANTIRKGRVTFGARNRGWGLPLLMVVVEQ